MSTMISNRISTNLNAGLRRTRPAASMKSIVGYLSAASSREVLSVSQRRSWGLSEGKRCLRLSLRAGPQPFRDAAHAVCVERASVFHLTDDSQVAANQPRCGHEARRYLHLREPGEPGVAQSDHCGSQQQNQDGLARADRACNG